MSPLPQMKITAGLGSIDDYIPYIEAGVDECFIGYVPDIWQKTWGAHIPLNRREVMYYNVQIGSDSELEILKDMIDAFGVPVRIAFNALYYRPDQYTEILNIIRHCLSMGYTSYIIADPGLLFHLDHANLTSQIDLAISGEFAEINSEVLKMLTDHHISRLIFHRKMDLQDQTNCIKAFKEQYPDRALPVFEAFMLNECCRFHGAFCQSLHCDELTHICHLPFSLPGMRRKDEKLNDHSLNSITLPADDFNLVGSTGCGLCALPYLQRNSTSYLKVVGRGNYAEDMIRDIRALRTALNLLKTHPDPRAYISAMKKALFPNGCSGCCYYTLPEDALPSSTV